MFKKLRNKFLILNMVITSLVMLSAFAIIYVTTNNNTQAEIEKKLHVMPEQLLGIKGEGMGESMNDFVLGDAPSTS